MNVNPNDMFYESINALQDLTPRQAHAVICSLADYLKDRQIPQFTDPFVALAFNTLGGCYGILENFN